MNKFEQVSSLDHQMSLAVRSMCTVGLGRVPCVWGACMMRSNASWVMVTWDPLQTGRAVIEDYLQDRSFLQTQKNKIPYFLKRFAILKS